MAQPTRKRALSLDTTAHHIHREFRRTRPRLDVPNPIQAKGRMGEEEAANIDIATAFQTTFHLFAAPCGEQEQTGSAVLVDRQEGRIYIVAPVNVATPPPGGAAAADPGVAPHDTAWILVSKDEIDNVVIWSPHDIALNEDALQRHAETELRRATTENHMVFESQATHFDHEHLPRVQNCPHSFHEGALVAFASALLLYSGQNLPESVFPLAWALVAVAAKNINEQPTATGDDLLGIANVLLPTRVEEASNEVQLDQLPRLTNQASANQPLLDDWVSEQILVTKTATMIHNRPHGVVRVECPEVTRLTRVIARDTSVRNADLSDATWVARHQPTIDAREAERTAHRQTCGKLNSNFYLVLTCIAPALSLRVEEFRSDLRQKVAVLSEQFERLQALTDLNLFKRKRS